MVSIVITGAGGFVGRELVSLLAEAGAELLVVGRDPAQLAKSFPAHQVCGYADLEARAVGFDVLVHLAVINNDRDAPACEFFETNVRLLLDTAASAKRANIARFINFSSVHALDAKNNSFYASSKREAARRLAAISGIDTITAYLPTVYGSKWSGRWAFLNKLPRPLAQRMFFVLSTLFPTVHISTIADFVLHSSCKNLDSELVISEGQGKNLLYRAVARTIDLTVASGVFLLLWWLMAIICVAIRIGTDGPAVFAQKRVGRWGAEFTCYKFRTMKVGTVQVGTDKVPLSAVTEIGAFLRRTKLDELPQIWNVFCNEMSLVGPRPCLPVQIELIEERRRRGVLELKPGISGLAQINGIDMSDPLRLARWDARYLAMQSLAHDLRIAIATVFRRARGERPVA